MPTDSLELAPRSVLGHYPGLLHPRGITPLGNRGGFSGARLWRVGCEIGDVCLRAWPAPVTAAAIAFQHELMLRARQAGLSFVPLVYSTIEGKTWVEYEGRLWEATSWQPGAADFAANPSAERLRNACVALANVHCAWTPSLRQEGVCPAVQRRLARAAEWSQLIGCGWRDPVTASCPGSIRPLVERACQLLATHVLDVPRMLAPFEAKSVSLQPCLCDVWHDHLLFEGETLTGLVDFGGAKIDHVSVDVARMLGSLVGDDNRKWAFGLEAYRQVRSFSIEDEAMARALDASGVIVGLVNWLVWIYRDKKQFDDWSGVARRMVGLIERIESWKQH